MAQKIKLEQKQSERLLLTNEMRQSLKMLSFNAVELNDYLNKLAISNPFIQIKNNFKWNDSNEIINFNQIGSTQKENLYDHLTDQVQIMSIDNKEKERLIHLIYCLDENGYLKRNLKELAHKFGINLSEISREVKIIQGLDPIGVGTSSLAECMLLQLTGNSFTEKIARLILKNHFQLLVSHRWKELCKIYHLNTNDWNKIVNCLKQLTATPGTAYRSDEVAQYIVPDLQLFISKNGKFKLELNKASKTELIFAEEDFHSLKQKADLKTQEYLNDKHKEFIALDNGLIQREKTLLAVANVIIIAQGDFLLKRQDLHPLILQDIAKKLQISISTVSRTINGKYIQTNHGIYPLKYFLSKKINSLDSNTTYSISEIKLKIKTIIKQEDKTKPLSDSNIRDILTHHNVQISRRTIAKYRDEMHIPNSINRKVTIVR